MWEEWSQRAAERLRIGWMEKEQPAASEGELALVKWVVWPTPIPFQMWQEVVTQPGSRTWMEDGRHLNGDSLPAED